MRQTRPRTARSGSPDQLVLDSWLDDAGPYLRLSVEGRGDDRVEAFEPAAPARPPALRAVPQA